METERKNCESDKIQRNKNYDLLETTRTCFCKLNRMLVTFCEFVSNGINFQYIRKKFTNVCFNLKISLIILNFSEIIQIMYLIFFKSTSYSLDFSFSIYILIMVVVLNIVSIIGLKVKNLSEHFITFLFFLGIFLQDIFLVKKENYMAIIELFFFQFYLIYLLMFYYHLLEYSKLGKLKYIIPFLLIISSICNCIYFQFDFYINFILISLILDLLKNHFNFYVFSRLTSSYDFKIAILLFMSMYKGRHFWQYGIQKIIK